MEIFLEEAAHKIDLKKFLQSKEYCTLDIFY